MSIKTESVRTPSAQAPPPKNTPQKIDRPVFFLSGGLLILFSLMTLLNLELVTTLVNQSFQFAIHYFGAFWQLLLLITFFIALYLGLSHTGDVRLGNCKAPELPTFQWMAIIMCTLLAGGGVFWAAAEPMAHFLSTPPLYDAQNASVLDHAHQALAQSFMHWGFLAWAILGSLTGIVLMHLHYDKGLPLKPRTLLYPIFGDYVMKSWLGTVVDASCVLAVVAGTVGPIGFLGLQVSYGLAELFSLSDTLALQCTVIGGLTLIYVISSVSGVTRGIQLLSRFNVILAMFLVAFIFFFGPTEFIVDSFVASFGIYLDQFIPMATYRNDGQWLGWWTVFFWGWFLGYGPLMAMFVARISRGRTIRQLISLIAILAPIMTCFWFTVIGGTGIAFEISDPGVISEPFTGLNLPAALLAMTAQLPLGYWISILFLLLTTIFVATTGDSMTYAVSMVMTGDDHPNSGIRVFWGVIMGVMAMLLISVGQGGISALQSFIVVTAVPVSFVLLPSLWAAPKMALDMKKAQQLKH
ncbi:Glycine betaine transporter 2 [Vibrio stylophorae]|uniref:Glycine betaine transporter 2 n=1 Tax=Vibrio stylophorae TaxID=659351 RepID=A0ABN8DUY2_9VIBR|nr:BCCT family transporter [Vibrio stylophorae]CAH0533653.1 Glycine betaine transporter 2 [Vibrio stylophorae]